MSYSLGIDEKQSQKTEPPSSEEGKFSRHTAKGGKSDHTHSLGHIQGSRVTFSYLTQELISEHLPELQLGQ